MLREVRHRVIGQNKVPDEAWADTLDDALRLIGKTREARAFQMLVDATPERQPALLPWLQRQPLRALALTQQAFAKLEPALQRVFITENEVNFLAFPPAADSLVVFGAGYGFDALAQAGWLHQREPHYWGDIDTHGFAILDQLRSHFPHAQSFLMDRDTLLAHQAHWTEEPQPTQRDLPRLSVDERRLFDDLRWRRLRDEPLRLEQERIAFGRVQQAVAAL